MNEDAWTNETFETLTLRRGSFDAVGLAAEQLPREKVTSFLIRAYDWNWLGVLKVVLDFEQRRHGGASPVDREFRDTIFALNSLRQFDLFEHTQEAVSGPLTYYARLEGALPISDRQNVNEILDAYRTRYAEIALGYPFDAFRDTFLCTAPVNAASVESLVRGPFLGWTSANMIRLAPIGPDYVERALSTFRILTSVAQKTQESVGVRWRIVHTLGRAHCSARVIQFLEGVLFDSEENEFVRFGAARSLMERAALAENPVERRSILSELTSRIGDIDSVVPRSELCQATVIGKHAVVPESWYHDVEPLLQKGLSAARKLSPGDAINWDNRLKKIQAKKKALEGHD